MVFDFPTQFLSKYSLLLYSANLQHVTKYKAAVSHSLGREFGNQITKAMCRSSLIHFACIGVLPLEQQRLEQ